MDTSHIVSIGGAACSALFLLWGFTERFKKERAQREKRTAEDSHKIIEVKDELIKVAQEAKQAWKDKYEAEHSEFNDYRAGAHKQLNDAQGIILRQTEEIGELRAKTDLTKVLAHQEQQSQINGRVLDSLAKLNTAQDIILQSLRGVALAGIPS